METRSTALPTSHNAVNIMSVETHCMKLRYLIRCIVEAHLQNSEVGLLDIHRCVKYGLIWGWFPEVKVDEQHKNLMLAMTYKELMHYLPDLDLTNQILIYVLQISRWLLGLIGTLLALKNINSVFPSTGFQLNVQSFQPHPHTGLHLKETKEGSTRLNQKVTHGSGCSEEVPFQNKPLAHPSQCSTAVGQTTWGSAQMTNIHKHGSGHQELTSLRLNTFNCDLQILFITGCYKNKSWPRITNHKHIMMWHTVRKHWCNESKSWLQKLLCETEAWFMMCFEHESVSETLTLDKTNMFVYPTLKDLRLK